MVLNSFNLSYKLAGFYLQEEDSRIHSKMLYISDEPVGTDRNILPNIFAVKKIYLLKIYRLCERLVSLGIIVALRRLPLKTPLHHNAPMLDGFQGALQLGLLDVRFSRILFFLIYLEKLIIK